MGLWSHYGHSAPFAGILTPRSLRASSNRTQRRVTTEGGSDAPEAPPKRAPALRRARAPRAAAADSGDGLDAAEPDTAKRRRGEAAAPAAAEPLGEAPLFIPEDLRADFDAVCRDLLS